MNLEDDKLFYQFVQNDDEKIEASDLARILQNLGQSVDENVAEALIKDVTNTNMNYIDHPQFTKIMESHNEEADIITSFNLFDKDGDGQITAAELIHQLTAFKEQITDDQVEQMMLLADTDGNGKLSLSEYQQIMKTLGIEQDISGTTKSSMITSMTNGVTDLWKSVNHLALVVSDIGRSAAFYGGILGMKQIMRPDFDRQGAWFTLGNIDLHLILGNPAVHPDDDLIVSHVALNCGNDEDVEKLMNRLKEIEVPFRENLSVPNPATNKRVKQAFVRDPDGYYIEFCSCEALEELLKERMIQDQNLWNFQRTVAALFVRSKVSTWVQLDKAQKQRKVHIRQMAKAIKLHGSNVLSNTSESEVADLLSIFNSTSAVLSVLKNKQSIPTFQIRVQTNNIEIVQLLLAASLGNLEALEKAFQGGMDMNSCDYDQRNCLHSASAEGHLNCVRFLVEQCKVDTNLKDRWGCTPFKDAEENNQKEVMNFLKHNTIIESAKDADELTGAELQKIITEIKDCLENINGVVKVDETKHANLVKRQSIYGDISQNATEEELSFLLKIFNNHVPHVITALREKVKVEGGPRFLPPAFYERNGSLVQPQSFQIRVESHERKTVELVQVLFAASTGNLSALRSAHEAGVDMDAGDYNKRTGLHLACAENKMDCIKFLVDDVGVELEPMDKWGKTPLDIAKEARNKEMVEVLSKRIRKLSYKKNMALMELLFAANNGDLASLQRAHRQGADLNMADYDSRTALHLACAEGHMDCVRFLVDVGVNVDAQDRWGITTGALDMLAEQSKKGSMISKRKEEGVRQFENELKTMEDKFEEKEV